MYFAMMIGVHSRVRVYNSACQFSGRLNNILLATASDL